MSTIISIDQLNEAIAKELKDYNREVTERIKEEAKKSMDQLVKDTKATAPVGRRQKHYRDKIKSKKTHETDDAITYTWFVTGPDYRLTHLLEDGHALRNGGRYEGTKFVKKASNPIIDKYIKTVMEVLKNG